MEQDNTLASQSFIPVILGANIGVYSTARAFHEQYGAKSINISRQLIGPVKDSVILKPIIEPNMAENKSLLECLETIRQAYPDIPKILIGSADWHVHKIAGIRDQLDEEWVIPYSTSEVLNRVTNKSKFYELCEELNVDYPKFLSFGGESAENLELPFDFPVVIKPANSSSYQLVKFAGKKKVFIAEDRQEFEKIISIVREGQYKDDLIIQEFVPGDDTAMHILTLYTAQNGETKLASFGQTLLEDHTPGGIGNPVVIRTFRNDEAVEQAKRIVEHVGYVGYSNFDLKYDERDGKYKFFELNPRLGRSNYYVTAEGHNTTEYYVKDYIENEKMEFSMAENEVLYTVVPKRLILKYTKQQSLKDKVKALYKAKQVKNPMYYFAVDNRIKRLFYVLVSTFNFFRKFKKYPPL
ncbi:ATP-grasp domain-containing protein [Radiobacillus sp. PE A8.2]|uniref:carboxylate--amine ligase n=1 Tax=Radiobacillus sp. PE A8.2 TaxID=3380349 RepID=UPI003890DE1A